MPFFGLFRPFLGLFWSKMARNEILHIMVKLGFFDAANPLAQKILPKNGVFCQFLAFLCHSWPFLVKNCWKQNTQHYSEIWVFRRWESNGTKICANKNMCLNIFRLFFGFFCSKMSRNKITKIMARLGLGFCQTVK